MKKNVQNKLICVFGLGMSGIAAARYLQRTGQPFFVADTRSELPEKSLFDDLELCQAAYFGEIPQAALNDASMIILSPGISPQLPSLLLAQNAGVEILGDIEIFVRQTHAKIIAITGSNGKSTVTDLTYQMLKADKQKVAIGGNFGVPVLDFLPQDPADIYVLELSSFQLDTTKSLAADVAVLLNVSEDHMDRYADFASYCRSKQTIFRGAKKAIVNADDANSIAEDHHATVTFSLTDNNSDYSVKKIERDFWLMHKEQALFNTRELKIVGKHNWSNALAVLAIITELGLDLSQPMRSTLAHYRGLAHRFQLVKTTESIDWINDSKATNVGATLAALEGVDERVYSSVILIAGGDAKGSDLTPLQNALANKITHLVVIGRDGPLLAKLVNKEKVTSAIDMKEAVAVAKSKLTSQGDGKKSLVLLSPACASLDMYKNYAARGDAFIAAVEGIA